ncbi:MAG: T9SS type A sorting domain-containing protein, partial [Flavobacterium sp.]
SINIKQVQELKVMTEPKFCAMNNSISLLSNIQLNGRRAKTNEVAFSVYRFNGDKNHANTGTNYITNDTLFTGSAIPGIWGMRAKAQEPACETEVFWNIDVLRKPQARFVLSPDSVVTLPPGLFASTNLSTPDSSKLGRWVWYTPGAVTDSTVRWEPNIAYDGVGNYEIRLFLIDSSGCFDTFAQSVRVGYNISVFDVAEMDIALFPNPTSGELNIVGAQIGGFRLYNAQGILVTKGEFSESRLSLEDYDAGVYMLQLEVNGARYSYKLQLNP